ncbi:hypothetical protein R5M92_15950 [Halomonas sp. Bachu 37]|uniref:hypothetical protein n=1 Tax=Halomonas kashgarensis TaxID=3084920 RepID=UPI003216448D
MKQQTAWRSAIIGVGLAAWLPLSAQPPEEQDMTDIRISIDGTPGVVYSAHWKITQDDGVQEHKEENGTVPAEYHFEGTALEGKVTVLSDEGRLDVDVQKDGNRSSSSTSGGGSTLNIAVR